MPGVARATPSRQREAPPTRSQSASWSISSGSSRRQVSVTAPVPTATCVGGRDPMIIAMIAAQNTKHQHAAEDQRREDGDRRLDRRRLLHLGQAEDLADQRPDAGDGAAAERHHADRQRAAVRVGERPHRRFVAVPRAAEQRQHQVHEAGADEEEHEDPDDHEQQHADHADAADERRRRRRSSPPPIIEPPMPISWKSTEAEDGRAPRRPRSR